MNEVVKMHWAPVPSSLSLSLCPLCYFTITRYLFLL